MGHSTARTTLSRLPFSSTQQQGLPQETLICSIREPLGEYLKEGAWEFVETLSSSENMLTAEITLCLSLLFRARTECRALAPPSQQLEYQG